MAWAQRHEFPIYWDFSVITLRGEGGGEGGVKRGSEDLLGGAHIKSAWKRNTRHSSITLHKCNKRMKRSWGGVGWWVSGCWVWVYIKLGCVPAESVPRGTLNKLITAIGFPSFSLFFFIHLLSSCGMLSSNWALHLHGVLIGREGLWEPEDPGQRGWQGLKGQLLSPDWI